MTEKEISDLVKYVEDVGSGKVSWIATGNIMMFNRWKFNDDPDYVLKHNKKLARRVEYHNECIKNYTKLRSVSLDELNKSIIEYLYYRKITEDQVELFREIICDAKRDQIDWSEYGSEDTE